MKMIQKPSIYLLSLLLLAGCGGGSNDNATTTNDASIPVEESQPTPTTQPTQPVNQKLTIEGNVIADTAIAQATLFWDQNSNGEADAQEPTTQSDATGHYQLDLNQSDLDQIGYINLIAFGGHPVGLDSPFEEQLSTIGEYNATMHLTPLTTLIAQNLEAEALATKNNQSFAKLSAQEIVQKIEEIKNDLSTILGIAKTLLTADPISLATQGDQTLLANNQKIHQLTKSMKKAMKQELRESKRSALESYRLLSRELRRAEKRGDDALIEAVEQASSDTTLFESNLVPTLKKETQTVIEQINIFWRNNEKTPVDTQLLQELILDLENRLNPPKTVVTPLPVVTTDDYPYIPKELNQSVAIRFLNKATFGATQESIQELQSLGVEGWIDKQLSLPLVADNYLRKTIEIAKEAEPTKNPYSIEEYLADNDKVFNKNVASFHSPRFMQSAWFDTALRAPDQLRHKLTYALSQIIVESDFEPIFTRRGEALSYYFDILARNAFGDYKSLLTDISFSASMGLFLTYNGNQKAYVNEANVTVYPDENYAREIMQLFSIGLNELNLDGSPKKDADGNLIPTYTQTDVNELARVFTGWDTQRSGAGDDNLWDGFGKVGFTRGDFTQPLEFTASYHDTGAKTLLGGSIPAGLSGEEDIKKSIDIIMANPNVAPYISRNLIMRLTKSNPSPAYIQRVATVFNQTQGDLKAVTKAILLDPEIWEDMTQLRSVKFKEPLIAYTEILRSLHVQPLPYWYFCGYGAPEDENASNCEKVYNKFLFNNPTDFLGQGAGRAPTVFNFYDNSFVPNDPTFKTTAQVAPELQIQDDTMLINFNNTIRRAFDWDITYMLTKTLSDGSRYPDLDALLQYAPRDYNIPIYYVGADKYLIDLQADYDFLEQGIDGDTDGDFEELKDNYQDGNQTIINQAVYDFIGYVDNRLLGGLLSNAERDAIYQALTENTIYNHWAGDDSIFAKKQQIMNNVIRPTYRAIMSSDKFMTE